LSTLTKILIVLMSLFSIFLCGIVVTYVSTAQNYKALYEETSSKLSASEKMTESYQKELEEKKLAIEELNDRLDRQIAKLQAEKSELTDELKNVERSKIALDEKVQNLATAALKFEETVGGMENSLKTTRADLDKARAEGIKLTKNLNEITASLEQKMAQLDSLDAEKKRLLEEKAKLEEQLSGTVYGSPPAAFEPVTIVPDTAIIAEEVIVSSISVDGVITAVEGKLATISVGAADGVQKGMLFHVIRNEAFVCDIKITEVDQDVAAGNLQLVQQPPRVGDSVSTSW